MASEKQLSEQKAGVWAAEFEDWTNLRVPGVEVLRIAESNPELEELLISTPSSEDKASDQDCIGAYYEALDQIAVAVAQLLLGREWPKQPGLPRVLYTGEGQRAFYSALETAARERGWSVIGSDDGDWDLNGSSSDEFLLIDE